MWQDGWKNAPLFYRDTERERETEVQKVEAAMGNCTILYYYKVSLGGPLGLKNHEYEHSCLLIHPFSRL